MGITRKLTKTAILFGVLSFPFIGNVRAIAQESPTELRTMQSKETLSAAKDSLLPAQWDLQT